MEDGTWKEFMAFVEVYITQNGYGNVDRFSSEIDGQSYERITVRRFDKMSGKWYISWYDSDDPMAAAIPSIGGFENGQGLFYRIIETENGQKVKVRFYWYDIRESSFNWESAWSIDGKN